MASRYLATVRRAMSTPASLSRSTMGSSEWTSPRGLGLDQLADAVAHGFGGVGLAAVGSRDRRGEEEFHLEDAARGRQVFVGGDPADGRFVHADRVGDGLQVQRAQVLDAEGQEGVLLAHDLLGDLEDGLGALVEALHQPVGRLQAVGDEGLLLLAAAPAADAGMVALVHEQARQGFGVQLDMPAAVGEPRARERRGRRLRRARRR